MKRIIMAACSLAILAACNSGDNKTADAGEKETKVPATTSNSDNPDYQKGIELVGKSGCFTCHKIDEKLTGPSYKEVAEKYASEGSDIVPKLAEKIIKGGSGVWGQVPMIAHPALSQADAEAMVKYILLLKK